MLEMENKLLAVAILILVAFILIGYLPPANNWNFKEIKKIKNDSYFCFSVIGDINGNILLFDKFLRHTNDSSFVVIDGNFINAGTIEGYLPVINAAKKAKVPILFVAGENENFYGNSLIFNNIFGNSYFSFNVSNSLFIVLDNSFGSIDVDQYNWLNKQLSEPFKNKFVFIHSPIINPWQSKYNTDDGKILDYLFNDKNVTLVISSDKKYSSFVKGNVSYVIVGKSGNNFNYLNVCISDGEFTIQRVEFASDKDLNYVDLIYAFFIICKALLLALVLYFSVNILRKEFSKR